jgi:pectin methylesterase-like acyl-CoA thioesterase
MNYISIQRAFLLAVILAVVVAGVASVKSTALVAQQACLHSPDESPNQLSRRRLALQTAREINTAEAQAFQQKQAFASLADLSSIASPEGFSVSLASAGAQYVFAVKDNQDPCRFAYFSDQDGVIYTGQPIR